MSFPVVTTQTGNTAGGSSHVLTLPTGTRAGDVLVAAITMGYGGGVSGPTWPAGWTSLGVADIGGVDARAAAAWRLADGSEGSTITVTGPGASTVAYVIYRLGQATGTPAWVGSGTNFNANPDPPNLTSGFGAVDTLYIATANWHNQNFATTGFPSGYSNTKNIHPAGNVASIATAEKQVTGASENPGTFTLNGAPWTTAMTIAVQGAAPSALVTQAAVEVLVAPDTTAVRATQAAVEVLVQPTGARARVTQVAIEALVKVAVPVNSDFAFDYITVAQVRSDRYIDARIGDAPPDTGGGDSVGVPHDEVYGSPVYSDVLIHPEVYGERPLLSEGVPVNSDLTFGGAVSSGAHADLILAQVVLNLATKNLVIDYVIDEVEATQVNSDLDFEYIIGTAGGAHKDLAFHYRVTKATKIQQRGANLVFKYQVVVPLHRGKDLSFKYKVTEPTHVGASRQFTYRINRNTVAGASLGIAYAVQKNTVAGASLGLNYTVLPVPAQAGLNLHFTYEVAHTPPVVVAGSDFDFDFGVSINNLVGASLFFSDEIAINVLSGADLPFDDSISINNLVGAELALDFEEQVKTSVGEDLDLDWDVLFKAEVGTELDIDAEVELPTPRTSLDFVYAVEQATPSAELGLDWSTYELAAVDLDIDRAIGVSQVGSELGFDYDVEAAPVSTGGLGVLIVGSYDWLEERRQKALRDRKPFAVGSELTIDYTVLNVIRSALIFLNERRLLVASGLTVDAPVANLLLKDLNLDAERFDMYDQNAALLLEEIDPDIAAMYHARNRVA